MGTDDSFSNVESSESASNKLTSVDAIGIIKYIVSSLEVSQTNTFSGVPRRWRDLEGRRDDS
jgi:hypothetical protein